MALAREGANVLLCGRSGERLESNCKAINAEGKGCADWIWADLNDEGFVEIVSKAVAGKLGGIDILINNTGGPTQGTSEDMTAERLETYFLSMVARVITLTIAPGDLVAALILAILIGLAGGLGPAWRAARLRPIDALRKA